MPSNKKSLTPTDVSFQLNYHLATASALYDWIPILSLSNRLKLQCRYFNEIIIISSTESFQNINILCSQSRKFRQNDIYFRLSVTGYRIYTFMKYSRRTETKLHWRKFVLLYFKFTEPTFRSDLPSVNHCRGSPWQQAECNIFKECPRGERPSVGGIWLIVASRR